MIPARHVSSEGHPQADPLRQTPAPASPAAMRSQASIPRDSLRLKRPGIERVIPRTAHPMPTTDASSSPGSLPASPGGSRS